MFIDVQAHNFFYESEQVLLQVHRRCYAPSTYLECHLFWKGGSSQNLCVVWATVCVCVGGGGGTARLAPTESV
jgi:hypothetical protein